MGVSSVNEQVFTTSSKSRWLDFKKRGKDGGKAMWVQIKDWEGARNEVYLYKIKKTERFSLV